MQQRNPTEPIHTLTLPHFLRVIGGILLGVSAVYSAYYSAEIFSLTHTLDFQLLGMLLLMGVPVLLVGWHDHERAMERA